MADYGMAVIDPWRGLTIGSDYVNKLYDTQAQRKAGQQYTSGDIRGAAATLGARGDLKSAQDLTNQAVNTEAGGQYATGDYSGAANTLAKGGNIAGAESLADKQAGIFQKQHDYLQRAVPVLSGILQKAGPQALGQAFEQLVPEFQAMGTKPEVIEQLRKGFQTNPEQTLQVMGATAQRKFTYQKVGEDIVVFDEQNPQAGPVATFKGDKSPPPGYQNAPSPYATQNPTTGNYTPTPEGFAPPDYQRTLQPIPGGPQDPKVIEQNAENRRMVIVNNPAPVAPTLLTPQAIDDGAAYFVQTGQMPPGMGRDRASVAAIQNRVAELKPKGVPTDVWMRGLRNAAIAFNAQKQAAAATGKQQALTVVNENSVNNSIKILNGLLKKGVAGTSSIVSLNSAAQWLKRETNDPDAVNLKNAVDAISAEYARVMTGQTGGAAASDSAREAAASRIILGFSKGTMQQAVAQLQQEMAGRSASYENAMNQLTGGTYGGVQPMSASGEPVPVPGGAPAQSNVIQYDAQGNRVR